MIARRTSPLIALTILAAMSAAACSDDSGPGVQAVISTAAPTTDPVAGGEGACGLVTTQEATTAMRKPMADGHEEEAEGGTICTWLSTDPPSEGLDSPIKLEVGLLPMSPLAQQKFDQLANSPDDRVVPGMGDLAVADCSLGDTDHCSKLFVVLGEQYLVVDMSNFVWPGDYDPSDLLGIVTEVAGQALLRVRK